MYQVVPGPGGGNAVATVIEADAVAVCAGLLESVAVTAKLYEPLVVGVPEIAPLLARLSPVGRLPEVTDQV
jgi:hypothetical protein